jgi:L-ascorbate metabolism protein UlaG (beta-lactamase superfamily)
MRIILVIILFLNSNICCSQQSVDVTYIANCGFLINGTSQKILVDGIFTDAYGKYHAPSTETILEERDASTPFDSINVVLVSHNHADHLNPANLAEHLSNDINEQMIGAEQVVSLLKTSQFYDTIKNRIVEVSPSVGVEIDTNIQQIDFKILPLKHPNHFDTMQNLGYIFNVNGIRFFHTGDAISDNLEAYQNYSLSEDSIDIAFIPRWFFDDEFGDKGFEIINYIHPKAIILMHIGTDKYSYYKDIIVNSADLPPVYIMENPMEKLTFIKDDSIYANIPVDAVLETKSLNENIRIFPNPSIGNFGISIPASLEINRIEIYNMIGRCLIDRESNLNNITINLSDCPKGLYLIKLRSENNFISRKIYLN